MEHYDQQGSSPLPKGIFTTQYRNGTATAAGTHAAAEFVLTAALSSLNISSIWRLGKLAGVPNPGNSSKWMDGTAKPGQRYPLRIAMMLIMKLDGTIKDYRQIDRILWDEGIIVEKSGVRQKLPGRTGSSTLATFRESLPPWVQEGD
jgi:hypothetical protein